MARRIGREVLVHVAYYSALGALVGLAVAVGSPLAPLAVLAVLTLLLVICGGGGPPDDRT